ncbi:MAG: YfiT family bacillithiol transferase [Bacteroidota bacterium]
MDQITLESLRYPIGRYQPPAEILDSDCATWLQELKDLPIQIAEAVSGLDDQQLDTPYREGGWTLRQVVHHVADSHVNGYIRFRWTLTEDTPAIKAYAQDPWSGLHDAQTAPIGMSLDLLTSLHQRWAILINQFETKDWDRRFYHPESEKEFDLRITLGLYAWHGQHHVAQILALRSEKNW